MLGKNSTVLLMCATATFVHSQASPDEGFIAQALQEAAEIQAAPEETAIGKDDDGGSDPFDETEYKDLLNDFDDYDDEDIAEDLANNDEDDELYEESSDDLSVPDQDDMVGEDDRADEPDNGYVEKVLEEEAPEDEMEEAADQDSGIGSGQISPEDDNDAADDPQDDDVFDEDGGLDNEDDGVDLMDDEDDEDLLSEDDNEDDDLVDQDGDFDNLLEREKDEGAPDNEQTLQMSEFDTLAAQSNITRFVAYYWFLILSILRCQELDSDSNVGKQMPIISGDIKDDQTKHEDGEAHTAEAEEEESIDLGTYMFVAGCITLLILWLMLRQCKQGSLDDEKKRDRRRNAQGYARPSQTENDDLEMSTMGDQEKNK